MQNKQFENFLNLGVDKSKKKFYSHVHENGNGVAGRKSARRFFITIYYFSDV